MEKQAENQRLNPFLLMHADTQSHHFWHGNSSGEEKVFRAVDSQVHLRDYTPKRCRKYALF